MYTDKIVKVKPEQLGGSYIMAAKKTAEAVKSATSSAQAAAQWWADVLRNPKLDNGDDSSAGAFASSLGKIGQMQSPIDEDGLARFRKILEQKIIEQQRKCDGHDVIIDIDYHPDEMLVLAAEESGLEVPEAGGWPWKTTMWVTPTQVSLCYGYAADIVIIWGERIKT